MDGRKWNGRYVAFARSNGNSPDKQREIDRAGSKMAEFMIFIGVQKKSYLASIGKPPGEYWPIENQGDFTRSIQGNTK